MQRIWGRRQRYRDRTVDVFVRKLRDKDRPAGAAALLHPHTPRGRLQARSAGEVVVSAPSRGRGRRERRKPRPAERLLNRELSQSRLERARPRAGVRPETAAARAREVLRLLLRRTSTSSSRCASPGLLDQAASGLNVRSEDGRRRARRSTEIRKRVEALVERQTKLWERDLCPALAREGIVVARVDDLTEEELARARRALRAGRLPGADAARRRARASPSRTSRRSRSAWPCSFATRSRGEERLARVKVPEGLPRFMEVGARGVFVPLEEVIAHFLGSLFPQMELSRAGRLPAHAGRRLRGLRRGRRPARGGSARAAPAALRRHRPHADLGVDCAADSRAAEARPWARGRTGLRHVRPARPRRCNGARAAGPARAEGRAVGAGDPSTLRARAERDVLGDR